MPEVTYTSLNADGENCIAYRATDTFSNVRNATSGTVGGFESNARVSTLLGAGPYEVSRYFFNFDTSTLPAGATINSATLRFYTNLKNQGDSYSLVLVQANQPSDGSLNSTDYNNVVFSSVGSLAYASITTNSYNEIELSNTSAITKSGTTKLALITSLDLNSSAPTADSNVVNITRPGNGNDSQLVIDYSVPGARAFIL